VVDPEGRDSPGWVIWRRRISGRAASWANAAGTSATHTISDPMLATALAVLKKFLLLPTPEVYSTPQRHAAAALLMILRYMAYCSGMGASLISPPA
jgi:hypothetical protein